MINYEGDSTKYKGEVFAAQEELAKDRRDFFRMNSVWATNLFNDLEAGLVQHVIRQLKNKLFEVSLQDLGRVKVDLKEALSL